MAVTETYSPRLSSATNDELRSQAAGGARAVVDHAIAVRRHSHLNMGVGGARPTPKQIDARARELTIIAGSAHRCAAPKSIAQFKIARGCRSREGHACAATVCGVSRPVDLDRVPRIRDFRGLNSRLVRRRGNYSLGIREQIIFPIDYDSITRSAASTSRSRRPQRTTMRPAPLLRRWALPFAADGGNR